MDKISGERKSQIVKDCEVLGRTGQARTYLPLILSFAFYIVGSLALVSFIYKLDKLVLSTKLLLYITN